MGKRRQIDWRREWDLEQVEADSIDQLGFLSVVERGLTFGCPQRALGAIGSSVARASVSRPFPVRDFTSPTRARIGRPAGPLTDGWQRERLRLAMDRFSLYRVVTVPFSP